MRRGIGRGRPTRMSNGVLDSGAPYQAVDPAKTFRWPVNEGTAGARLYGSQRSQRTAVARNAETGGDRYLRKIF